MFLLAGGRLTGKQQQRCVAFHGFGERRQRIRHAWPLSDAGDTHAPADACVAVGHGHGSTLMPGRIESDTQLVGHITAEAQVAIARQPEDLFDAEPLQRMTDRLINPHSWPIIGLSRATSGCCRWLAPARPAGAPAHPPSEARSMAALGQGTPGHQAKLPWQGQPAAESSRELLGP